MNRYIKLTDCADLSDEAPYKTRDTYPREVMQRAREACSKRGLRWDNTLGRLRDNTGELSRYARQADYQPHATREEVMGWEFVAMIRNSASRITRGFEP